MQLNGSQKFTEIGNIMISSQASSKHVKELIRIDSIINEHCTECINNQ